MLLEEKGDMAASLHHLRAAASTYEQCYGVEHAETLDAQERIARLAESECPQLNTTPSHSEDGV